MIAPISDRYNCTGFLDVKLDSSVAAVVTGAASGLGAANGKLAAWYSSNLAASTIVEAL